MTSTSERARLQQVEQRSIPEMEVRHAVLNTKRKRRSYFLTILIDPIIYRLTRENTSQLGSGKFSK